MKTRETNPTAYEGGHAPAGCWIMPLLAASSLLAILLVVIFA